MKSLVKMGIFCCHATLPECIFTEFFGPELPFKFLDVCCFRSIQWRTRRAWAL